MSAATSERVVIQAARLLRDGDTVLVGVGEPGLAASLAKLSHAPDMTMVYESGVIDARPERAALSIGDPCLVKGAASVCSMHDMFTLYLSGGRIGVGLVGCAQIDRLGRINTTVIGKYHSPATRLPGSGGASEIARTVSRLIVITKHDAKKFPGTVDFVTSCADPARTELIVVTDLALLRPEAGELTVTHIHSGVSRADIRSATGWPIAFAGSLRTLAPPTPNELALYRRLRDQLTGAALAAPVAPT